MEAFLAYWLSQYMLLSGQEDGLNLYVSPYGHFDREGVQLAIVPLYLISLYTQVLVCEQRGQSVGG